VVAVLAKALLERFARQGSDLADRLYPQALECLSGNEAYAPQPADRKGIEELLHPAGLNHHEPVRLLQVAGNLSQELVGRHAHRRHQPQTLADLLLDAAADFHGRAEQRLRARDVQERLVQRQWLDEGSERAQDLPDLFRNLGVVVQPRRQHDRVRAEPPGGGGGHGAMHTVFPHLVVGRRDHAAPLRRAAHDDGFADQLPAVPLLDRGVEGVHVNMEDHGATRVLELQFPSAFDWLKAQYNQFLFPQSGTVWRSRLPPKSTRSAVFGDHG
jgi:hypothetical protein